VPTLLNQGGSMLLGYAIHHQPGAEAADQIYDLSIAVACNIMRALCGTDWNPANVLLSRRPPPDLTRYRRFFRAPLCFNADRNAVVFPSRWLNHRIRGADALLYRHLERAANELHARRKTHIVSEVRGLLLKSLADRQSTIGAVARQIGMHERTLHRRLRKEGTSFQRELDDVRHEMARQLLAGSAMSIARVATTLNYADASAFSRAFKRWTGVTPARWRKHT
jgi:AraC-like DNA-binding protein